ncbi:hypothetical protein GY21_00670 [Cryobacterium roopkundense]|uniref:Uncharacterized protein (DUF427 family) n=1 Tax=Cryobacterium roopkundense TaxID=1001240 RepID=A0A099JV60_9MICO|nr:DUF427 domain-containing protein [Cryobacterium roopkundense]KGJ82319.1 hypothetical protein GY21_00670 [Cryobacterium roopkundense]MBB5639477.1 uncharacterized protein (DUF427 family) [Cryobacterium roopkundense]
MKAVLNGVTIAEAPEGDLIKIEGNWYFPPQSVNVALLEKTATPYTCSWKGDCQYFTVTGGTTVSTDAAFSYPAPYPASFDRVGQDFSDYVAFWKDVRVTD